MRGVLGKFVKQKERDSICKDTMVQANQNLDHEQLKQVLETYKEELRVFS